jgi:5-methylcytosine-specific restriction endonuclease McrA
MSESGSGEPTGSTASTDKDPSVCPTCGQECKSVKGKRQHHKRSHGESIAKVELECEGCGDSFERWKTTLDEAEKKYCSPECYHSNHEQPSGESNPLTDRVTVSCGYCGCEVERRPSRVNRAKTLYCSRECADKDHSERMQDEGNPRWEGGEYQNYYGPNWDAKRAKAKQRDNHRCQLCGVSDDEATLSVHHNTKIRVFKREFDAPEWWQRGNALNNLVTLCLSCHGLWEGIPVRPKLK